MVTFSKDLLYKDDFVVYLKNEKTGSSTTRKCKFIGQIVDFTDTKVKIIQLSKADQFVNVDELCNYGEVSIYPDDIVHVLHSRHDLDNSLILPHTIGGITFYSKEELIEWVENQQKINKVEHKDCSYCKNGTYRKPIHQYDGTLIRHANFCDECGRDLRYL